MGIPVYLDETAILNLNDQSYWYCGALNLNGANRNFISFDFKFEKSAAINELKRKFRPSMEGSTERRRGQHAIPSSHRHKQKVLAMN